MKKNTLVALAVGAVVGFVAAAYAGPRLNPANYFTLTNCAADGSTNTTITVSGDYLMTVTDERVYVCLLDAGCDVAGHPYAADFSMRQSFNAPTPISCRSTNATGDVTFTQIRPGT